MDKFHVMTPKGEIEVAASSEAEALDLAKKNWQSMPKIIAKMAGSVRVFERDNGQRYVVSPEYSTTDPKRVADIMAGQTAGQASTASFDESTIAQHPVAARANQFLRGPMLGSFADEAMGNIPVIGTNIQQGMRASAGAMQRQRPVESAALNIAGGLTEAVGLAAAAPQALAAAGSKVLGSGPRIMQIGRGLLGGGLIGATQGGIYGAGEGTDTSSRVSDAKSGAGYGALGGVVVGAATPLVSAAASNVISALRRSDLKVISSTLGISSDAAKVIKNTFEMGGSIDDAVNRLTAGGDTAMIADAGPAAQALLDAVAASGASASQAVRGPIDQRMTQVAGQLNSGLTNTLGMPAAGPQTAVNEIMQRTAPERAAAYGAAYQVPIDYAATEGRGIEGVLSRVEPSILKRAIDEANAEMLDKEIFNQQIMAKIAPDGSVKFSSPPNVRQLDELKKALNSLSQKAKDTQGVAVVETPQSLRYSRQANDLRDALSAATGGDTGKYAAALKVGGDTIGERNAFLLGERLLDPSTRVEDVVIELNKNPSNAAIEAAKRGLRTQIDQIVGDVKRIPSDPNIDARQALATLRSMGSDNARTKISSLMGADADKIFKLLDEASVAAETRAALATNSKTVVRDAVQSDVRQLTTPNMAGQLMTGDPINTTKALVQAVTGMTNEYTTAQQQKIYLDLAKALTAKRGPDAIAAMRMLDTAMKGQEMTDKQTSTLAKLISNALFSVAAPAAGRAAMQATQR